MVNVFRESLIRFPTKIATHLLRDVTGRTRCVVFSLQIGSERRSPKTYNTFLGTGRTRRVVFSSQIGSDRRSPYDPFDTFLIIHTRRDQLGPRPFVLRAQRPARQDDPQPSTLEPQPSSVTPHPSLLNLQPSTPNPQPSTLHPPLSTRNPQPATLSQAEKKALIEAVRGSDVRVEGLGFGVGGAMAGGCQPPAT